MADLVRVRIGKVEKNMGRALAERSDNVTILDEPTHRRDGSLRGTTRHKGRPAKPRTSVDEQAAEKKATARSASTEEKEQDRT